MSSPNTASNKDVYTAVSMEQSNVQQELNKPLLSQESSGEASLVDAGALNSSFRFHGLVLGFLAQIINVTGTTYMYYRWGGPKNGGDEAVVVAYPMMESFLHGIFWIVTQVDLYLYVVMWLSLTAVLTRTGMEYVRHKFFLGEQKPTKRSVFVLGVQFYVGVVFGVFFAWTGIDMFLGLPVPVMPMVNVLIFGLFISYTMVWCYDLEDEDEEESVEGTFVGV
jgi:hypothetical protein